MRRRLGIERALVEDLGLALGAAGLLALLGGGALYALVPELQGWAQLLLAASLVSIALFFILARHLVARLLATRQGRYGLNTLVLVLTFGTILGLASFLSYNRHLRVDLTATRQFTLSEQTVRVLQELQEPVVAHAFFTPDNPGRETAESFLREYSIKSTQFDYELLDPETDPAKASLYQVDQDGLVVFASGGRAARTAELSEQAFTATLLRSTGRGLKTVCFLTGHGERSILGTTDQGLSQAGQALERELYIVRDFAISSAGGIPKECAVVVVAGADRQIESSDDPAKDEGIVLRNYLAAGGNALFLLGPEAPSSWAALLKEAGIEVGGGAVVDPASFAQPDRATPAIQPDQYQSQVPHPITQPLIERSLVTFFPLATRVAPLPQEQQPPGIVIIPLFFTTPRSWLESDLANVSTALYDPATDKRGPLSLAVAAEFLAGAQETGRVAVIGSVAFAGNKFFASLGNGDLFVNAINWLTEQEELISIRPKLAATRLLVVTQREWSWILYSSVAILPLLVSLIGAWTWWRRR